MTPSTARRSISNEIEAFWVSWLVLIIERWDTFGRQGYLVVWVFRPVFDLGIAALIYAGGREDLIPYLVVAMSANAFVWNSLFWVGEILDRERKKGTLLMLFLSPCSRFSWLLGFAGSGIIETVAMATTVAVAGMLLFDVRFQPNIPAMLLTLALFVSALLGLGLVLSGIGLLIRKSNELANLVYPAILLLGGSYYPVGKLPTLLRIPARALPNGYGMDALASAALRGQGIWQLRADLLPLAGFAVGLPVVGALTFTAIERLVRDRGELDLV